MKKITKFLVITLMMMTFMVGRVNAEDVITYNANEWATFKNRTKADISERYGIARLSGDTYRNGVSSSYYKSQPSLQSPYAEGELTGDTHTVMTEMTNFYRWLVGVNPLTRRSKHIADMQAGALVRNWQFDHVISASNKPEDMSETLWNRGADIWHNILAWGYTPLGSIPGWLDEGYNLKSGTWDTIGHRMALIGNNVSELDFGYAGSIAIGVYESNNKVSQAYTAYPAPGYMPYNDMGVNSSSWDIQLNTNIVKNANPSEVIVRVTNLKTNTSYDCTTANGKLSSSSTLNFVQPEASGTRYANGDKFKVEVFNLVDVATGKKANLVYTTEFFDVTDGAATYVKSYKVNGWSELSITSDNATTENLNYITSVLPKAITVITENGRSVVVSLTRNWVLDTTNKCWATSVDTTKLPSYLRDLDGVLSRIVVNYKVVDYTGSFTTSNTSPMEGTSGYFRMWRYMSGREIQEIYQVANNKVTKRFDNTSSNYSILDSGYINFAMDAYKTTDSGKYFGIYYTDNANWDDAYFAGITTVNVQAKKPISSVTLNKTSVALVSGKTEKLTATINPSDTTDSKTLTWTSSNTKVATVDANGNIKAISAGTANITVKTSNGKTATAKVTVTNPQAVTKPTNPTQKPTTKPTNKVIAITSVKINQKSASVMVGKTTKLTATINPSNTTQSKTLTWTSSNTKIATVDKNGVVKGIKAGTANITVKTSNGKTATIKVTVVKPTPIKSVKLNKKTLKLELGKSATVKATINPSNTTDNKTLTWSSSNKKVATVDQNGKITAIGAGTATITVKTTNGKKATVKVTVSKINAKKAKITAIKDQTQTGKALKPAVEVKLNGKVLKNGTDYTVTYKNNKNAGKATVTVKFKGNYTGSVKSTFLIIPSKVAIKNPTTAKKSITVKYSKVPGAKTYQVAYRLKGTSKWSYTTKTKLTKLTSGKEYEVMIRAGIKSGKTVYGAWSDVKTIKVK